MCPGLTQNFKKKYFFAVVNNGVDDSSKRFVAGCNQDAKLASTDKSTFTCYVPKPVLTNLISFH